jgi:hypothetical protein
MTHLRTAIAGLIAAAALALPAAAWSAPRSSTAQANRVTAGVSVTGKGLQMRIHLKIGLNGQTALNQVVNAPACGPGCATADLGGSTSALRIVDLNDDGTPEVVLGLYSGGAHCCFVDQVYSLDPGTMTFVSSEHQFLDADPEIADLQHNRQYEFLSADARIAEAGFTDFADSGAPVQIFAFPGHGFRDVTDSYPARITADAVRWLRLFNHDHANGRGLIAAWAADEERLGNGHRVSSTLASARKHGWLAAPPGLGGPSPHQFVAQLQKLLRTLGYTH